MGAKPNSAHPDESRDPGLTLRLVPSLGCSLNSKQASTRFLDPDFRRDERWWVLRHPPARAGGPFRHSASPSATFPALCAGQDFPLWLALACARAFERRLSHWNK